MDKWQDLREAVKVVPDAPKPEKPKMLRSDASNPAPAVPEVRFVAACSGLQYENPMACGEVSAVIVNGKRIELPATAVPDVDLLAQFIRRIDGNNKMGAGALAEAIHEWITASQEGEHPALSVPESRNVMKIEREGDQSVKLTFASCRSCSAFISALIASKEGQ